MIIAALFVAVIAFSAINEFFDANVTDDSRYIQLVKERIDNGNVKVIAGVFDANEKIMATQSWEGEKLDDELEAVFNGQEYVLRVL